MVQNTVLVGNNLLKSRLLSLNAVYDVACVPGVIRLTPYKGGLFHYLTVSDAKQKMIAIPTEAMYISGLGKRCQIVPYGDSVYLLENSFRGDLDDVEFSDLVSYTHTITPTTAFFREVGGVKMSEMEAMPTTVSKKRSLTRIPDDLMSLIDRNYIPDEQYCANASVFADKDRRWLEIRPYDGVAPAMGQRFSLNKFVPSLSGITYRLDIRGAARTSEIIFPEWTNGAVAWYSETREAVIIEAVPDKCAICGAVIRSIDDEHFNVKVCDKCAPFLGKGAAIDAIMNAIKTLDNVERMLVATSNN